LTASAGYSFFYIISGYSNTTSSKADIFKIAKTSSCINESYPSLKISGVASQFAMQNSGNATPEVEVHSSFAIPKSGI
jgi:hypothetical protein